MTEEQSKDWSSTRCPPVSTAHAVWKKYFPVINVTVGTEKNSEKHWSTVKAIVTRFTQPEHCPDPISNFSDFIVFLHRNQSAISPKSVEECVAFSEKYDPLNIPYYIIFQAPLFFGFHFLYLETVQYFANTHNRFWTAITKRNNQVDSFFQFYNSLLLPVKTYHNDDSIVWKQRLTLSTIIFQLLSDTLKSNPNSLNFINKYCDKVVGLVADAPTNVEISLVRYVLTLTKRTAHKTAKDVIHSRFSSLLSALAHKTDSQSFYMLFLFIFYSKPRVLAGGGLLRALNIRESISTYDIALAGKIADTIGPVPVLSMLARWGLRSKVWHRACFFKVREILVRKSVDVEVCEWAQLFIRRLAMFVPLAARKLRYRARSVLVCETLAAFGQLHLVWAQQSVAVAAASVIASRLAPPFFSQFFPSGQGHADSGVQGELMAFWAMPSLDLKLFPFDGRGFIVSAARAGGEGLHTSPRAPIAQPRKARGKKVVTAKPTRSHLPALKARSKR